MALGYNQYQRKLWKTRAVLAVLVMLCVVVGWSAFTRWQVEREMAHRAAAVEAEYEALHERYTALEEEVAYLNDERSLESEIRKHFDVAREGESVVILVDNERTQAPTSAVASSTEPEARWWQFWR